MSTTTVVDMARSSFSTAAFAQLVRRLRHTNARYNQIARQFRCRIRPVTHHAKRRAYRAGLRIDILKAHTAIDERASTRTLPVLVTTPLTSGPMECDASQGDTYMRASPLRNLPEVKVRKQRCHSRRQRITLRLPPLQLQPEVDCEEPAPGAPRLLPKQLPADENGVEEMMLPVDTSKPGDPAYSGLCIIIPPRGLKRKFQDVEPDEIAMPFQQPKRILQRQ